LKLRSRNRQCPHKYWEPIHPADDAWPTTNPQTLAKIVAVLEQHGVEVFCDPTPGVRMTSQKAPASA